MHAPLDLPGNGPPAARETDPLTAASFLRELEGALEGVLGTGRGGEVLFRLGRSMGSREGAASAGAVEPARAVELAASWIRRLGLGDVRLEVVEWDPEARTCRVAARVQAQEPGDRQPDRARSLCALASGFITGVAGLKTGVDLVSTRLACHAECPPEGCAFEILPAVRSPRGTPTTGSARFFLDALGPSLGEADISLADLVENTLEAIILIDDEDVIRFWNRGAESMFGYPREEAVGRRVGFIVPRDLLESDELGWMRRELARRGFVRNHETRRMRRDGAERTVHITRTVLHDSHDRPVGSTAIIRDVTELRTAEDELQAARTLAVVGTLAAKIAHEIKNPLAGISGAVQILLRSRAQEDPEREIFEGVLDEVNRLDVAVQDLLRYARPRTPRLVSTDLRTFLQDVGESLGCRHELGDHALAIDVPPDLVVRLDATLMAQVFSNLLHNAAQAMTERGRIRISAAARDGHVSILVTDTGPGIPAEVLPSVFEPFFTTKSRGTGLGLAIAKKNVEGHGGRIAVDSPANGGAVFRVELPIVAPPERDEPA